MEKLIKQQKSLMVSSLNKENPEISYAPFVMMNNKVYLYLSKAANHYHNLVDNNKCSVMIIEDEKDSKTIFARQRVLFECIANKIEKPEENIFEEFERNHGAQMMMVLRTMDFDIFELEIKSGRLVLGFGKAYDVVIKDNEYELIQVTGIGHR